MFQHIIARMPCRALVDGITSASLGKPDYALALDQHNAYIRALQLSQNATLADVPEGDRAALGAAQ